MCTFPWWFVTCSLRSNLTFIPLENLYQTRLREETNNECTCIGLIPGGISKVTNINSRATICRRIEKGRPVRTPKSKEREKGELPESKPRRTEFMHERSLCEKSDSVDQIQVEYPWTENMNPKYSKVWNFLSADMTPQLDTFTPDLTWQVIVKTQVC